MEKLKIVIFVLSIIISHACYSKSKIIYVDSFIPRVSDTRAIYEALEEGRKFNGEVTIQLGSGNYEVNPNELLAGSSDIFLYEVYENLKIQGTSNSETTITLKKGWPNDIKNRLSNFIFFGSRENINNFELKNISIDFKGDINAPRTVTGNLNNAFIYIKYGHDIHISNIRVLNNPGRQSVFLGGADKSGDYTMSDVIVEESFFKNNTDHFSSNTQNDHSSIYMSAENAIIRNNHLISGDNISKVSTAIEGHLINSQVVNNKIEMYDTGVNVVGTQGNQLNTVYANNTFLNVNKAFVFWGNRGRLLSNITIRDNIVRQNSTSSSMLSMGKTLKAFINNLTIEGNTFSAAQPIGAMSNKIVGNCIDLGYVKNVVIKNNTFDGVNGRAITLSAPNINIDRLVIEGNNFVKTNSSNNPKYSHIIGLKGVGKIGFLQISNNNFHNHSQVYSLGNKLKIMSKEID